MNLHVRVAIGMLLFLSACNAPCGYRAGSLGLNSGPEGCLGLRRIAIPLIPLSEIRDRSDIEPVRNRCDCLIVINL